MSSLKASEIEIVGFNGAPLVECGRSFPWRGYSRLAQPGGSNFVCGSSAVDGTRQVCLYSKRLRRIVNGICYNSADDGV